MSKVVFLGLVSLGIAVGLAAAYNLLNSEKTWPSMKQELVDSFVKEYKQDPKEAECVASRLVKIGNRLKCPVLETAYKSVEKCGETNQEFQQCGIVAIITCTTDLSEIPNAAEQVKNYEKACE